VARFNNERQALAMMDVIRVHISSHQFDFIKPLPNVGNRLSMEFTIESHQAIVGVAISTDL